MKEDPVLRETDEFPIVNRPEFGKERPAVLSWHHVDEKCPPFRVTLLVWRRDMGISEGVFPIKMPYIPTHWALYPNTPE